MNDVCKIPVSASFQIINGEAVMIAAEYADIPADKIAAYIMQYAGRGGERNNDTN